MASLGPEGNLVKAAFFIGLACVVDYFDGFIARWLKVSSEIGKELDSLADVVSFGVAPAFIFYMLGGTCFTMGYFCINTYVIMLLPVFSALRLAKFNLDTRQSDSFIGIPTPANALFIGSIPLILEHDRWNVSWLFENQYFLVIYPLLMSWLMISEIPLLSLKFKNFKWEKNKLRFILILITVLSFIIFGYAGIPFSIVMYVLLSVSNNMKQKADERKDRRDNSIIT
jgi:CDP-diacylglycerol--serine O-phosphatidyltransferase